ncbi:MAG: DNA internalization-related competence protein ComEC/Rec2 [Rhodothermales bacterium]
MPLVPRIAPHTWLPLVVSGGLVLGGSSGRLVWTGTGAVPVLALGTGWAVLGLVLALRRQRPGSTHPQGPATGAHTLLPLLGVAVMALTGFVLGCFHSGATPAPFRQEPRLQVVEGSVERVTGGGSGFLLCRRKACVLVRLPQPYPAPARSIPSSSHTLPIFAAGSRVVVRGRLRAAAHPLNPFDFDEASWLRGLGAVGVIDEVTGLYSIHGAGRIQTVRMHLHRQAANTFDRTLATPLSRALARALWLGDRSHIPEEVQATFADSGLAHVLAVSGLHVGFVALALVAALRMVLRRVKVAEGVRRAVTGTMAAVGLVGLSWWMGPAPSVERAAIMGAALLVSGAFRRKPSPRIAFAWAILLSLFMTPTAWRSVGWQLSFSAVGAILLVLPWLSRLRRRPAASALVVTAAAWLGTAPVLVLSFGQSPAAGAALSPLAVPLMAPMLLTSLSALVDPGPLSVLLTEALAATLHAMARFGSSWPDWTRWSAPPGVFTPLLLLPWMGLWALRPGPPRARTRRSTIGIWVSILLLVLTPRQHPPIVQQLHVGQGDASIIMLPGRTLVIDSGPSNRSGETVAAHITGWGRRRIDGLIHSHEHADHTGGTPRLAHLLPVQTFASQHTLRRGDTVDVGPGARLYVLGPARHPIRDANNDSVVLRLQVGRRSWLFLGDTEAPAERSLVRHMGPMLDVDVVKAGHHGSATSSTPELIAHASAATTLISAGRNNRFAHPDPSVVDRWARSGARVHVTFSDGAWISPPDQ